VAVHQVEGFGDEGLHYLVMQLIAQTPASAASTPPAWPKLLRDSSAPKLLGLKNLQNARSLTTGSRMAVERAYDDAASALRRR
jgi:hypothetical protein